MATRQVREIFVKVDTSGAGGIKQLAGEFSKMNKGVKDFNSTLSTFKNAFIAIQGFSFAGMGLDTLINTFDSMQKLGDRLKITEGGIEGATVRIKELAVVAGNTNTSIEDSAQIYTRLSMALGDAGVSSEALIGLTETLQNTFRLSGSTAEEARAAVIQLSQGLASGQLRGQELRSVLEANVVIGDLLSKTLGTNRGELLKFAEKEGGINAADFMESLAKGMKGVDEQAKQLRPTIREAITTNLNALKITLNELNKEWGISEKSIYAIDLAFKALIPTLAILAGVAGFKGLSIAITGVSTAIGTLLEYFAIIQVVGPAALLKLGAAFAGTVGAAVAIPVVLEKVFSKMKEWDDQGLLYQGYYKTMSDNIKKANGVVENHAKVVVDSTVIAKEALNLYNEVAGNITPLRGIFDQDNEGPMEKQIRAIRESADRMRASKEIAFDYKKELIFLNSQFTDNAISLTQYNQKLKELKIKDVNDDFAKGNIVLDERNKRLNEINNGKYIKATKDFQLQLADLNKEFNSGKVSSQQYSESLRQMQFDKLNKEMSEGKKNIYDFNELARNEAVKELNKNLNDGTISVNSFNDAITTLKLDELNDKLQQGTINTQEFKNATMDLEVTVVTVWSRIGDIVNRGTQEYLESSGTLAKNLSSVVSGSFYEMEDRLFDFIKTGKFAFKDFVQSILDDLTKVILRMAIVQPLAQAITGGFNLGSIAAQGNIYSPNGVQAFANGGIVSSPTLFKYGSGKNGLMGEAGPEAIIPLTRTSSGDLGVKAQGMGGSNVVVNVVNNSSDSTVEQTSSRGSSGEEIINVVIKNKIKESMSDGSLDKTFQANYGVKRRGT